MDLGIIPRGPTPLERDERMWEDEEDEDDYWNWDDEVGEDEGGEEDLTNTPPRDRSSSPSNTASVREPPVAVRVDGPDDTGYEEIKDGFAGVDEGPEVVDAAAAARLRPRHSEVCAPEENRRIIDHIPAVRRHDDRRVRTRHQDQAQSSRPVRGRSGSRPPPAPGRAHDRLAPLPHLPTPRRSAADCKSCNTLPRGGSGTVCSWRSFPRRCSVRPLHCKRPTLLSSAKSTWWCGPTSAANASSAPTSRARANRLASRSAPQAREAAPFLKEQLWTWGPNCAVALRRPPTGVVARQLAPAPPATPTPRPAAGTRRPTTNPRRAGQGEPRQGASGSWPAARAAAPTNTRVADSAT